MHDANVRVLMTATDIEVGKYILKINLELCGS
jgi:hypothetical protein